MRKRSLFNKKIKCGLCNFPAKKKQDRKIIKYLCSNYDNFGNCQRNWIREDKLRLALFKRFRRDLTDEEIREVVIEVVFRSDTLFDIVLTEGKPISYYENGIIF